MGARRLACSGEFVTLRAPDSGPRGRGFRPAMHEVSRRPRPLFLTATLALLLVVPRVASAQADAATTAANARGDPTGKGAPRVLIVPAVALGDVRPLFEKRVAKAMADAVQFSTKVQVVTDRDRPAKGPGDGKKAILVKGSLASRRIDEADVVRQEATDLAAEDKHAEAYDKFREAIVLYEKAYMELVDFTKLADGFARAGITAYRSGAGGAEATRLFEQGIVLQPTLVIDRRKQSPALLALFDGIHERVGNHAKINISVECLAVGAEAFIDGVRVGPLPAIGEDFRPGTHYVQIRGGAWQPWGAVVRAHTKDVRVACKPVALKVVAAQAAEPDELSVATLEPCARQGAFHTDVCRAPMQNLARQTGTEFFVLGAIRADRYGRLTYHPFAADATSCPISTPAPPNWRSHSTRPCIRLPRRAR